MNTLRASKRSRTVSSSSDDYSNDDDGKGRLSVVFPSQADCLETSDVS